MEKRTRGGARSRLLALAAALALPLAALPVHPRAADADESVRPSALAGTWYPADPRELRRQVDGLLDSAKPKSAEGTVRVLIVPHAGYPYSGATAAQGFDQVRGRSYRRVLILAPTHYSPFHGLSIASVSAYETPVGRVPLDMDAVAGLRRSPLVTSDPIAHTREHSIEIELPFLQEALKPGWTLIPILVGQMDDADYRKSADLLKPLADAETLVVVSSDFTHYGPRFDYVPFPPDKDLPERLKGLDDGAVERIVARDRPGLLDYQSRTGITVCGIRPLALMLDMLPPDARVERIAYATSGQVTGDWGNSVSYEALAVTSPEPIAGAVPKAGQTAADPPAETPAARQSSAAPASQPPGQPSDQIEKAPSTDPSAVGSPIDETQLKRLHRLAVLGIQQAVLGDSREREEAIRTEVAALPDALRSPSGAFVTLKHNGELRGCIGYIKGIKPLYQAVVENGRNAAVEDPRFDPVQPNELPGLDIEVSILSPLKPIDSLDQFKVGEEGITLRKGFHAAVFLPEVATEQGWNRDQTLAALSRKAGLPPDAWREGTSFEVFTSTKYEAPYPGAGE